MDREGFRRLPSLAEESNPSVAASPVSIVALGGGGGQTKEEAGRQIAEKAARSALLEKCWRDARARAAAETVEPIIQGRIALLGLIFLAVLRGVSWYDGNIPGGSALGMHFLTTTADLACLLGAVPLFLGGTTGPCVRNGCVGPMMTLIFAMSVMDVGALAAYLVVATPRPLDPEAHSWVDVLQASVGTWEFSLFASVALEVTLCRCAWAVYKELRLTGLYPPGSYPVGYGKIEEVSCLEVVCEAEEIKMIAEWDCTAAAAKGQSQGPTQGGGQSAQP